MDASETICLFFSFGKNLLSIYYMLDTVSGAYVLVAEADNKSKR